MCANQSIKMSAKIRHNPFHYFMCTVHLICLVIIINTNSDRQFSNYRLYLAHLHLCHVSNTSDLCLLSCLHTVHGNVAATAQAHTY